MEFFLIVNYHRTNKDNIARNVTMSYRSVKELRENGYVVDILGFGWFLKDSRINFTFTKYLIELKWESYVKENYGTDCER